MKYNIVINQDGLLNYNERNPGREIDFVDAILLQWIFETVEKWEGIEQKKVNGKIYYWIAYNKFLKELPSLGIGTKDGIYNRLKKGLIRYKLLEKIVDKHDNNKTFFYITPIGRQTVTYRTADGNPIGQPSVTLSDDKQHNSLIIDPLTKDEREVRALFFLNANEPKRYASFMDKYKPQIKDFKKFELDFNDTVEVEQLPYDVDILFSRCFIYARNWIEKDKRAKPIIEDDKQPTYLRKIL